MKIVKLIGKGRTTTIKIAEMRIYELFTFKWRHQNLKPSVEKRRWPDVRQPEAVARGDIIPDPHTGSFEELIVYSEETTNWSDHLRMSIGVNVINVQANGKLMKIKID